jgi:uncharacterized protein (DUF433 family)
MAEATEYVRQTPEGGWRIAGTRVSLDSLVHAYWEGRSPEAIVEDFPTLRLEQVHGAIAYYLRNRPTIDRYMSAQETLWEQFRHESEAKHSPLLKRIRQAQHAT